MPGNGAGQMVDMIAADVDGDGHDDLLVDGPLVFGTSPDGPADGWAPPHGWDIIGSECLLGLAATGADVDGDGDQDVLVSEVCEVGPYAWDGNRVHVLEATATGLSAQPIMTIEVGSGFSTLSSLGDLDGDGFGDVVLGPEYDWIDGQIDACGDAWHYKQSLIWHPNYKIIDPTVAERMDCYHPDASVTIAHGGASEDSWWFDQVEGQGYFFGLGATSAGDVNHDGLQDLWMGYGKETVGIWLARSDGTFADAPDQTFEVGELTTALVHTFAGVGDINGDGHDDVAVGLPGIDVEWGEDHLAGAVWVFHGNDEGLSEPIRLARPSGVSSFGASVAGGGDVNGDGLDDVLVGTLTDGAYVFLGVASGAPVDSGWALDRPGELTSAGDIDGDGFHDVLARPRDKVDHRFDIYLSDVVGSVDHGAVQLYFGSATGLSPVPGWEAPFAWGGGERAVGVRDVDGDGLYDLLLAGHRHAWLWTDFEDFDRQVPPDTEYKPSDTATDTGATGDTGTTAPTTDTPAATDSGEVETEPKEDQDQDQDSGCGCAAKGTWSGDTWLGRLLARRPSSRRPGP